MTLICKNPPIERSGINTQAMNYLARAGIARKAGNIFVVDDWGAALEYAKNMPHGKKVQSCEKIIAWAKAAEHTNVTIERYVQIETAVKKSIPEWATNDEVVMALSKIISDIAYVAIKRVQLYPRQ